MSKWTPTTMLRMATSVKVQGFNEYMKYNANKINMALSMSLKSKPCLCSLAEAISCM